VAGGLQALAGFVFREQAVMDGAFAGVVDLVGDAREIGVDTGELEVVVDLVEQVAQRGCVAVAGADHARELGWELLLDGFFKHGAAHDGAGGEEAVEVAAGGFVEVAVGFFCAGRGDDTLTELGGARDRGFDELKKFEGEGGAEQIILLDVEGALNFLPGGGGGACLLEAGERGEALAGVLDEAVAHFLGEFAPSSDKGGGILAVTGAQFVVDNLRKDAAELMDAVGAGELGDGVAEAAAGRIGGRHGEELLFEKEDVDGHGAMVLGTG